MREKYITVNRDLIRLKIRGLLKKEIVDSNPLIVEFILNKVMGYNVVDEFLKASVLLEKVINSEELKASVLAFKYF